MSDVLSDVPMYPFFYVPKCLAIWLLTTGQTVLVGSSGPAIYSVCMTLHQTCQLLIWNVMVDCHIQIPTSLSPLI